MNILELQLSTDEQAVNFKVLSKHFKTNLIHFSCEAQGQKTITSQNKTVESELNTNSRIFRGFTSQPPKKIHLQEWSDTLALKIY